MEDSLCTIFTYTLSNLEEKKLEVLHIKQMTFFNSFNAVLQ